MKKYPEEFSMGQIRTLQRRIAQWRQEQTSQEEKMRELMMDEPIFPYNSSDHWRLN